VSSIDRPNAAVEDSPAVVRARAGAAEVGGSSARQRQHRPTTKFVQTTHDQLAVPLTRRGSIPDGDHLSPTEKLLMIALEVRGWQGGPCTASNLQLAEAIGLEGSHASRVRYIKILFGERKIRGTMRPGLVARGWVEIVPDIDPRNPTGRKIVRAAKWREYRRKHAEIRVFNEGRCAPKDEGPDVAALPPAAAGQPVDAAPSASPSDEILAAVLGTFAVRYDRAEKARVMVGSLRRREWMLKLQPDGKVRPDPRHGNVEPLSEEDLAVLKWLKATPSNRRPQGDPRHRCDAHESRRRGVPEARDRPDTVGKSLPGNPLRLLTF
jgi:hypothetical protein